MKVVANIKYGVSHEVLDQMIEEVKTTLKNTPPVSEPITALLDSFDKETFQLVVSYHLPHPLPEGDSLADIKHKVNLKVFEIISKNAKLGTPVGTA